MFREGTNKKGLIFFIIICLILFIYLAWQSGGNIFQEGEKFQFTRIDNYQVQIIYPDWQIDLWRVGDKLKFQIQDDNIEYYVDEQTEEMWAVRPTDQTKYKISSLLNNFSLDFDPLRVVDLLLSQPSYESEVDESGWTFYTQLNNEKATIYFDNFLPTSIYLTEQNKIVKYIYEQIGSTQSDLVVLPTFESE